MYKRHNIWDEDKLDIHSSGYAGHGHGSSGNPMEDYHRNEVYTNKQDALPSDDYRSRDGKEDDKKKQDDEKEKTIVDAVEQEEKYQKKEEQEEGLKSAAKGIQHSNIENDSSSKPNNKDTKKKNTKNIEEAINEAIKEEKEIIHLD
ncbi:MAG: hypothetical protein AABX63_03670 [Nanoarchaeota archaeon]